MTDDFFDKYVYEAVVDIKYFDPDILEKILLNIKSGNSYTYKYTDAFGVVAFSSCKYCSSNRAKSLNAYKNTNKNTHINTHKTPQFWH